MTRVGEQRSDSTEPPRTIHRHSLYCSLRDQDPGTAVAPQSYWDSFLLYGEPRLRPGVSHLRVESEGRWAGSKICQSRT